MVYGVKIMFKSIKKNLWLGLILLFLLSFLNVYGTKECESLLFPIQDSQGKYGYINKMGKVVVKPNFEYAAEFHDRVGVIHVDDESDGIVNTNGKIIILSQIDILSDFYKEVAIARIKEKYGLIDNKGNVISYFNFEVESSEYRPSSTKFSDSLAMIPILDKGLLFVNEIGKVELILNSGYKTSGFNEGLATITFKDGSVGVIDKTGNYIINPTSPNEQSISVPSEGLVRTGKHFIESGETAYWKYFNKEGKVELEVSYDYAGDFVEGVAQVLVNKKWGYMDKNGKIAILPQFDLTENFKEGLAAVKLNDRYGFIDKSGEFIIEPQFDTVYTSFKCGVAYVQKGKVEGYINKSGSWIWKKTSVN